MEERDVRARTQLGLTTPTEKIPADDLPAHWIPRSFTGLDAIWYPAIHQYATAFALAARAERDEQIAGCAAVIENLNADCLLHHQRAEAAETLVGERDAEIERLRAALSATQRLQEAYKVAADVGDYPEQIAQRDAEIERLKASVRDRAASECIQYEAGGKAVTIGPFCGHEGRQCLRSDQACLSAGKCIGLAMTPAYDLPPVLPLNEELFKHKLIAYEPVALRELVHEYARAYALAARAERDAEIERLQLQLARVAELEEACAMKDRIIRNLDPEASGLREKLETAEARVAELEERLMVMCVAQIKE